MAENKKINRFLTSKIRIISGIILSGAGWYFSNGLNGDFWYLAWFAPVPVIFLSLRSTARIAFFISFIAYFLGRLSWFGYLVKVATLAPAIIYTIALPFIFALLMLLIRWVIIRVNSWHVIFTFPVFMTAYEFLMISFSPDGTATSIAYTQMNFLPIIQIAEITGILGITFMVTFIPSVIALAWYYRREKLKPIYITGVGSLILVVVLLFGIFRINNSYKTVNIGLVVLNESLHSNADHPDFEQQKLVLANYAKQITILAKQGAQLVLLPERAISINMASANDMIGTLSKTARSNHVFIVTGYTNFINSKEHNSALVIDTNGNLITDYNKVYLVKGLETQFTPGTQTGLFKFHGIQAGVAICKDLDFPNYIKQYANDKVVFLVIPAWDFVVDDWLHCRMAVLRGVEDGFSEIRSARQGRLTVSDFYGRVTYEANCTNGQQATLLAKVSTQRMPTFYTHFGNWFGMANLTGAICFLVIGYRNRQKAHSLNGHLHVSA